MSAFDNGAKYFGWVGGIYGDRSNFMAYFIGRFVSYGVKPYRSR